MITFPWLFIAALYTIPGPVSVTVRPAHSMPPAAFQATVIIERHADNRLLIVEYDGPEFKRSYHQIDGAQRTRVFQPKPWELRSVGDYVARAILTRIVEGKERTLVGTATFRVIGTEF